MQSENKKVLFIINKFSGTGYKSSVEGNIIKTCSDLGYECFLEFTNHRGHATELATKARAENFYAVFAVGGDGTLNEVARALVDSPILMGIVPKGSGNGLARHLGIPMAFKEAIQTISSADSVAMDTILINGHLSINVSGIGFDGHIAQLFAEKSKRGLVNYARLVLNEYKKFEEFEVSVSIETIPSVHRVFMLSVANSSQFGNNARIAPHASVCDGKMDILLARKPTGWEAINFAYKMFTGQLQSTKLVKLIQAKQFNVKASKKLPWHVDGEAMEPTKEFTFEINPAALRMIIPSSKKGIV